MPTPRNLLVQTDDFCFFAKPRGIATIPGTSVVREDSFWARAEAEVGQRLWVVHRLDRGTSGVVLFAKNANAHAEANDWFGSRRVKKKYWFIAEGTPRIPMYRIEEPIDGKRSLTQVRVLEKVSVRINAAGPIALDCFRGEATPTTGRKHQIRIHLASLGHPIVGDREYGARPGISPHFFLHARSLEVPGLPVVEAPLPEEWKKLWP